MAEKNSLKVVAGLFRNTDKKGGIYYSGKSEEGEEYVMFRNSYWKEGSNKPYFRLHRRVEASELAKEMED